MAASTKIGYDPAAIGGIHVANAVRYAIMAQQEIARAVNLAAAITAFGVTDTNLEGPVACPEFNVTSGQGATFYSAITSLQTALANATAAALANLDKGG